MAATLIQDTDAIDVSALTVMIYGAPGAGKTSLAQTADEPLTLDLDRGVHRSRNRRAAMRFDTFADVAAAQPEIAKRKTAVVDTVGRLLDMIAFEISGANALNQKQWGFLKSRFQQWSSAMRQMGKDVILIAHEKEERDDDGRRYVRPDIQGGSYTEVFKVADLVGYLYMDVQGRRTLDFSPTARYHAKNACGWKPIAVPDFADEPAFLAKLLADAKSVIGKTSQASAKAAEDVERWKAWLGQALPLEQFNGALLDMKDLPKAVKAQVWKLVKENAESVRGWRFDKANSVFVNVKE